MSLNTDFFGLFQTFSDFFRNLAYFGEKRQKRGGERGEGGGKISHFRLNTSSEVFRDFQRFSKIFRDSQGI